MSVNETRSALIGGMICGSEMDAVALKFMLHGFTLENAVMVLTSAYEKYGPAIDEAVAELERDVSDTVGAIVASGGRSS